MNDDSRTDRLPRITVITPCRNGARFIAEAVESVRRQGYPDVEHIVLDACSTDGTLAVLGRYPEVAVISESDAGPHDAMNRGVSRTNGEVVGFLNVDDFYPDGVLHEVGRTFAADANLDLVVGGSIVFEDDGAGRRQVLFLRSHRAANGLWIPELTFGVPGFNGCFFRRRVFEAADNFRIDYPLTGERLFLLRLALAGRTSKLLDRPTIWYRLHPQSRTINREMRQLAEISREYVRMSLELTRRCIGRPEHRIFLAWHAFEAVKLIVRSLRPGRLAEAIQAFAALNRNDPLWLFRLAEALRLRRAVRRLDVRSEQ